MTPQELYENVSVDNLYFLATGGGVTFGGGEPPLYGELIHDFCRIVPQEWNICIETSLNTGHNHMEKLLPHIAHWHIDIKDMDDRIYRKYTGKSNEQVIENLKRRALDANLYSAFSDGTHRVSFDKVVNVMKQTGHDIPSLYKETGSGGLAKILELKSTR